MTNEELVVEFALTRLDHPGLELDEVAALLVRRIGTDRMLQLAAQNLAVRDELRGDAFASAVEYVLRTVLGGVRDDPRAGEAGVPSYKMCWATLAREWVLARTGWCRCASASRSTRCGRPAGCSGPRAAARRR